MREAKAAAGIGVAQIVVTGRGIRVPKRVRAVASAARTNSGLLGTRGPFSRRFREAPSTYPEGPANTFRWCSCKMRARSLSNDAGSKISRLNFTSPSDS